MKKKIFIILGIMILSLCAVRIYLLNSKEYFPVMLEYNVNEEVEFEKDFFDYSDENMSGYSINVTDSEIIPINDFISTYNVQNTEDFYPFNYVCLVNVKIRNIDNSDGENAGINLRSFMIQSGAYMTYPSTAAFGYVNDIDYMQFSLRYNSDKDFIIPFLIYNGHVDINTFKKMSPQLVVSLFPNKKVIKL